MVKVKNLGLVGIPEQIFKIIFPFLGGGGGGGYKNDVLVKLMDLQKHLKSQTTTSPHFTDIPYQ